MASTRLAASVGYPGTTVAFAQLLSGMERAGLITREVRGKRTYRISLGDVDGYGPAMRARASTDATQTAQVTAEPYATASFIGAGALSGGPLSGGPLSGGSLGGGSLASGSLGAGPGMGPAAGDRAVAGGADFDYDELARRLLVQVVRRLAAEPDLPLQPQPGGLRETVADLEHELASAWTKHGRLAEENIRLREQLRAAQRSLAMARDRVRRLPLTSDLDSSEVVLLQRLLSTDESPDTERRGRGTAAGW
jgi:hypothetical protein